MNKILKTFIVIALVATFTLVFSLKVAGKSVIYYQDEENKKEIVVQKKDSLDLYLDRLAVYECRGCKDGFAHLDSNGKFSYSCLQFQEATFDYQKKKYGVIEGDIDSCEAQKRLARIMFQVDEIGAARHWYTSIYIRGLGLPSEQKF